MSQPPKPPKTLLLGGGAPAAASHRPDRARWIAGPLVAIAFAGGTFTVAQLFAPMPRGTHLRAAPRGQLRLGTDPPGATVTVDGKPWNHFTPTVIDGEIGATLRLGFALDGYQPKEAEVYIAAGEHPFAVKLLPSAPPVEAAPPRPVRERHRRPAARGEEGSGSITVRVRPWAIVYVDGERLRQTPITDYQLSAGKHTVELVNAGKSRHERLEVQLKNGEMQEISRDWD